MGLSLQMYSRETQPMLARFHPLVLHDETSLRLSIGHSRAVTDIVHRQDDCDNPGLWEVSLRLLRR
jgi:hypothetical protein